MSQKNELSTIETQLALVDDIAAQKGELFSVAKTGLATAIGAASAIVALRKALTDDVCREIGALQGTALGFLTDQKDGQVYPLHTIRDVAIEASLRGLPLYGNCVNIIGGRLYVTKEGFRHRLSQIPGLTMPTVSFGASSFFDVEEGGTRRDGSSYSKVTRYASIECKASWELNGVADSIEKTQNVKVNSGMGLEGSYGKAERKMLRDVYHRVTGTYLHEGDAADAAAEKQVQGTVVNEQKLPASAVVSESGNPPAFLQPGYTGEKKQEGQTDRDREIQERVNSQPVQPAKPKKERSEAERTLLLDFAEKLKKCCIDGASASAAFSRVLKAECNDWRKLPVKTIAVTMDGPGWEKFSQAIADIAAEQEAA